MRCQSCGNTLYVATASCPHCGWLPPTARPYEIGDNAAIRMLLPVGRSGWAIAAGYAGLFAVICFPAPLALFFGVMAIIDLKRNPHKHGWGRAIFGAVMGAVGTLFLMIGILPALFAPR